MVSSEVYYRKWRPQTLSDVAGQEHITQTLLNALAQDRVAHAYLFCGPRGTGKTSTGRILAKAVNCFNNGKGEPCNACSMCTAITDGSALDLIEIDAASNRGIDEIRELRERVNYSPTEARFKVYIIDEVHMLTDAAFNALLKTLEEPPAHVIFVLATTEIHKLPATIVSRCQRFDFRRIPNSVVEETLNKICAEEGVQTDPWVLRFISRSSGGSLRDAENLLEQLVVSYGNNIKPEHVKELLGISVDMPLKEFVVNMLKGDLSGALLVLQQIRDQGVDPRNFQRELLEYLRTLLLARVEADEVLDIAEDEKAEVKDLASNIDVEEIAKALHLFGGADTRTNGNSLLPLETALVDFHLTTKNASKRSGVPESGSNAPTQIQAPPAVDIPPINVETLTTQDAAVEDDQKTESPVLETASIGANGDGAANSQQTDTPQPVSVSDIETIRSRWPELVNALRGVGSKGSLDALLRNACEPVSLEGETLVVGFYYPFHKSKIEDPKYRHLVEKKLNEVFKSSYRIRCDLVKKSEGPPSLSEHGPLVKAALDMGARIIDEEAE